MAQVRAEDHEAADDVLQGGTEGQGEGETAHPQPGNERKDIDAKIAQLDDKNSHEKNGPDDARGQAQQTRVDAALRAHVPIVLVRETDLARGGAPIEELLDADVRNNSAWNQRYFVVSNTTDMSLSVRQGEVEWALAKASLVSAAPAHSPHSRVDLTPLAPPI